MSGPATDLDGPSASAVVARGVQPQPDDMLPLAVPRSGCTTPGGGLPRHYPALDTQTRPKQHSETFSPWNPLPGRAYAEVTATTDSPGPAVELRRVCRQFGPRAVLDAVSLAVARGEFF